MKTKCPNCGAIHSLDSLLAVEDAADLMAVLAGLAIPTAIFDFDIRPNADGPKRSVPEVSVAKTS